MRLAYLGKFLVHLRQEPTLSDTVSTLLLFELHKPVCVVARHPILSVLLCLPRRPNESLMASFSMLYMDIE